MDGEGFDRMTKSLTARLTRRRVLRGVALGGAGFAASVGIGTAAPACGQSSCKAACTAAGFTGNQCSAICGSGQFIGACPVGQGGGNPCCNPGYCNPANFVRGAGGNPVYTGPTSGCG
jgi:hypothetical protein